MRVRSTSPIGGILGHEYTGQIKYTAAYCFRSSARALRENGLLRTALRNLQQIHVRASKNVRQPLDIGTDVCRIISVLLERGSHSAERNCTKPNCMKRVRTDLIRVAPSNPRTIGSVCMRTHRRRYRRRVLWCREGIAGGRRRFTHRRRRETPHNAPHKGPGWSSRQHGQISTEV